MTHIVQLQSGKARNLENSRTEPIVKLMSLSKLCRASVDPSVPTVGSKIPCQVDYKAPPAHHSGVEKATDIVVERRLESWAPRSSGSKAKQLRYQNQQRSPLQHFRGHGPTSWLNRFSPGTFSDLLVCHDS